MISAPVTALLVMNDDRGGEIMRVTVLEDASDAAITRIDEAMAPMSCVIDRRPLGYGVTYHGDSH